MSQNPSIPCWTLAGLIEGARLSVALLPGCLAMAMAIGTLSAQKGLSLLETVLMSGVLFAGASQLVALEIWTPRFTLAGLVTIALVATTVNLRYLLMTASLRPWIADMPAWKVYPALLFTVDANWLVAMRYRSGGGADPSIFLGSGLILWICWVAGAIPGHLLGRMVADPARFGLDLALPAFFAAMLVPLWKGPRWAITWAVAGATAWLVSLLLPGWWFIIAGALAGSIAGGFIDERA
ncbi:MAG TPA: AzlC family ABC transporter permease [Xanthobacteraceae bacterium]|nr:AzlC family ABC transporter permease [Xanthobacteraceae bacterium]